MKNPSLNLVEVVQASLSVLIICVTLYLEGKLLLGGMQSSADPIAVGRILGTLDSALLLVLGFWFGKNSGTARTTELLAKSNPVIDQPRT